MKNELITEISSKPDIKCSQRRNMLDIFFSRLDSEADKIQTSEAYLDVKHASTPGLSPNNNDKEVKEETKAEP